MKNVKINFETNEAIVTKAFQKQATIYGTPEFRQWREIRNEFPGISMVVAKSNRKSDLYNTTYAKMEKYIKTFDNAADVLAEMAKVKERSKIQRNPHRYVLAWFESVYPDYKTSDIFQEDEQAADGSKVVSMPEKKFA